MTDELSVLTLSVSILIGFGSVAGVLAAALTPLGSPLALMGSLALPFVTAGALVAHALAVDVTDVEGVDA